MADLRLVGVLERILAAANPQEGCALLLGQRQGDALVLRSIWPCCNRWPEAAERGSRFAVDPREQLLAQKWARLHKQAVLGFAHSHPQAGPDPSATDLELAVAPVLMVIQGLAAGGGPPVLRCWWIEDNGVQPQPLPWRMGS
ncbi:M67 family metallopeptidase [Cyanobium sp. HWJ4-Hawea]|nr:M67 family metallopeptidase [Cyanobium sp. HWJ4-Hawea]